MLIFIFICVVIFIFAAELIGRAIFNQEHKERKTKKESKTEKEFNKLLTFEELLEDEEE